MKQNVFVSLTALVLSAALLTGCTATAADIGRDAALEAALNDAGITETETTRIQISEDSNDGRKTYDIRFDSGNTEYDYEILASDGKILSSDVGLIQTDGAATTPVEEAADPEAATAAAPDPSPAVQEDTTAQDTLPANNNQNNSQQGPALSLEEATQIALDQVPGATAQDIRIELDRDHNRYKYEGEMIHEQVEYEFEIDGDTGAILEWKEEPQNNSTHHNANANVDLTVEEAIQIALDRVPGATAQDIVIELERDDGQYKYEGNIIHEQIEYDFEIDANTGTILEWSEDR